MKNLEKKVNTMRYKFLPSLFMLVLSQVALCQKKEGIDILMKHGIKSVTHIELNKNGFFLSLKEKEAKKIAEKILYNVYGRANIRKQKPFHVYRVDDLWIFRGAMRKNRRGGVFTIVINSKNGCVEHLSHER